MKPTRRSHGIRKLQGRSKKAAKDTGITYKKVYSLRLVDGMWVSRERTVEIVPGFNAVRIMGAAPQHRVNTPSGQKQDIPTTFLRKSPENLAKERIKR